MDNLKLKIKHTQEVESEIYLPKYFTLNNYHYYKLLSDSAVVAVNYYTDKLDNMVALELFPSIRVENIRYVSYILKADNIEEITKAEFESHLNAAKKLIYSL